MHGALHAKILRSSRNASAIRGSESMNWSRSKNDCLTRSHPEVFGTNQTISPTTATVLPTAMVVERRCWRATYSARRVAELVVTAGSSRWCAQARARWSVDGDDRCTGLVRQPLLL